MRILILAHELHPLGGLERCHLSIADELVRRGHDLSLLYLRDGDLSSEWASVTRKMTKVKAMQITPGGLVRSSGRVARAALGRHGHVDLVYASHYRQLQLAASMARLHRAPLVFHVHNVAPRSLGPVGRRQVRWPTRSVAVSHSNARLWWALGQDPSTTRIIHNGVDADSFSPLDAAAKGVSRNSAGIPGAAFVVAFVGGKAGGKGAGTLLEAWSALGLRGDEGRLLILGRPDLELRRRLDGLDRTTSQTVLALGQQAEVAPWLQLSDVIAVPSNSHDPCPLAVLEGMACGRPVVGSRIGGIPELLTGDLADLLVDPGDAVGLAKLLQRLLDEPERSERLGAIARRHVLDGFTLERMVDELEAVFSEVTRGRARTFGRATCG